MNPFSGIAIAPKALAQEQISHETTPREKQRLEGLSDGSENVDQLINLLASDDCRLNGLAVYGLIEVGRQRSQQLLLH